MNTRFSPVIAGTMLWGSFGRKLNTRDMAHLIRHCVLNGIHTFDHADIYGGYTTEADFGAAFVASGIKRSEIRLISKCGINMICEAKPFKTGHYNYTRDYILRQCEQSLVNLCTDHLDLLLLHRPSPLLDPHIVAEVITRLKEEGKILSFGLSNFTPSQTELVRQLIPVEYNQIEFSVTRHEPLTDGSLDHMMLHKITPMSWAPMGTVFKHQDEQSKRVRKVTGELAVKYGVEEETILLAWIHAHPAGIIPVVGTADELRISRLRRSLEISLELEEWFTLYQAGMGHPVP